MENQSYSITYVINQTPTQIFDSILNVREWWTGLYAEEITGNSNEINNEFTFRAGDGMHYSKHKLVELIPNKKIVWLVTESELSFLQKKDEWIGTKLCFEFVADGNQTEIRFTHLGLVPSIECYHNCSVAWSAYMEKFLSPLLKVAD
jgi:hypothetical protein